MSSLDIEARCARALEATQTTWGQSRWNTLLRCETEHELRYEQKLEKIRHRLSVFDGGKPNFWDVGNIVHSVLRFAGELAIDGHDSEIENSWGAVFDYADEHRLYGPIELAEATRLLQPYWERWGYRNAGWENATLLECESLYETSELGPLPHTTRLDTLLRLPHGDLVISDTKTRASAVSESNRERFAEDMAVRPQFLSQAWHVRRRYRQTPYMWVNIIVKTKVPSYDRILVQLSDEAIDRWAENQIVTSTRRAAVVAGSYGALRNYDACIGKYDTRCEFYDYCHGPEIMKMRYQRKEIPDAQLSNV